MPGGARYRVSSGVHTRLTSMFGATPIGIPFRPARAVHVLEHVAHVLVSGRRVPLHVRPDHGAEDADRGKRADARDVVDGADRVLDGLDPRDDLPRDGALSHLRRRVFQRVEERPLPQHGFLPGEIFGEVLGIVELVAEGEVVHAEVDQPVVVGEVLARHELEPDERPHP
jgi:hypothetical protein